MDNLVVTGYWTISAFEIDSSQRIAIGIVIKLPSHIIQVIHVLFMRCRSVIYVN